MSIPTPPVIPTFAVVSHIKNTLLSELSNNARQTNAQLFSKELALIASSKSDSNSQQVNTAATSNSRLAIYAPVSAGVAGTASTGGASMSKSPRNSASKSRRQSSVSKKR